MLPRAIIVDLDGTLADCSHRRHHVEGPKKNWPAFFADIVNDEVNRTVLQVVQFYAGFHIVLFVTGRGEEHRHETEAWLRVHVPAFATKSRLIMRRAGDRRSDVDVKMELYRQQIENRYDVRLVLDDRNSVVKMWRSLGLECWQVAEGDF
jgi:FMN phosphatase YigB (HAD superfamily)